jgi:polysaccharide export outer membrane protein
MLGAGLAALAFTPAIEAAALAQDAAVQTPAYRINAGDQLEIYVWGEERLQRVVSVLPDGTIAYPLIGQMQVRGLLPQELEARVREGLRDQYRGEAPQVTVSVVPVGMQFSIIGKVRSPGVFQPGRYVNALEALSLAGGPNEFADLDNVVIIRKTDEGLRTINLRMAPLFRSGIDQGDIRRANIVRIESGDTVIVP